MTLNLAFDFLVDKENKIITVKREFAVGLPLVWDAFTTSEILDRWWAPEPWTARTKTMVFREGGHWHYAMISPKGEEHWSIVKYETIQLQKSYTHVDAFTDAAGNINKELPQSRWEVTFTGKGQLTLVECLITFDNLAQLEALIRMGFKEGMTMCMEGLDELFSVNSHP